MTFVLDASVALARLLMALPVAVDPDLTLATRDEELRGAATAEGVELFGLE